MRLSEILTIAVAAYAAFVATAALALEVRRWFESGPRITIHLMPHGQIMGGGVQDKRSYIFATITNRGVVPTTVTNFGLVSYDSAWAKLRGRPTFQAIVPRPAVAGGPALPHVLQPGTQWVGGSVYNAELADLAKAGRLYVQIWTSHRGKPTAAKVILTERDRTTLVLHEG